MRLNSQTAVVDAENLILGRMASAVAKWLLQGQKIAVVNAEKAVISGRKRSKVKEARTFLEVGYPRKGPYHYRRPDRIVRRVVRGMLPYKQPKGRQAFGRLKVFMGVPDELRGSEMKQVHHAHMRKLSCPYLTVGDLSREIGWNPGG